MLCELDTIDNALLTQPSRRGPLRVNAAVTGVIACTVPHVKRMIHIMDTKSSAADTRPWRPQSGQPPEGRGSAPPRSAAQRTG